MADGLNNNKLGNGSSIIFWNEKTDSAVVECTEIANRILLERMNDNQLSGGNADSCRFF